jgi:uncharacterized DUF497 family protein
MQFEWDEEKCKKNIETHGIDFVDAAEIFSAPILVFLDDRKSYGESRYIGMGEIQGRIMVIVYTERKGDVIRIISLRKANKREQSKFKKEIKNRLEPG